MSHDPHSHSDPNSVELPIPTAWPIISAFGITLMVAGLVTDPVVSLVGFLCALSGAIGWFTDVFPHPKHEPFPIRHTSEWPQEVVSEGRTVSHLHVGEHHHREQIPTAVHPYTAGFVGGLLGAVVMAFIACAWGLLVDHSIWYPINLLAAAGYPDLSTASTETLKQFSLAGLIVATITHLTTSVMVGLLYTVLLPMLPAKREWLFGGIVTPIIWTALIWATLRFINPTLNERFEWIPFLLSQIAFGMVCGFYVYRSTKVSTQQGWTVAARLGVEAAHHPGEKKS
ncbi:MAG TPA: hypothetical protein VIM61_11910 [Chthoniobacterales bacterium]|jgi:hypothetical protein